MWFVLSCFASAALAGGLPGIDEPLKTGAKSPADAAVVIGIEDYAFVADVPYASRDAQAMYDFLVYTRGVPAANVRLLKGASREQMSDALNDAAGQVGADGTLWVYYAGHGAASASSGERLLLGDDVKQDPAAFETRALRLSEIKDAAKGKSLNLMVDACYSGLGRGGAEIAPGKRFAVPSYAMPAAGKQIEWNAAAGDQLSGPIDAAQHGAFTYFAIGALRGWADGQVDGVRDGQVTAEEADLYVKQALRTVQITSQTPVLTAVSAKDVVMTSGKLEAPPKLDPSLVGGGSAPVVAAPKGKLDPRNTEDVSERFDQMVMSCREQHSGGEDATWSVRVKIKKDGTPKGVMIYDPNAMADNAAATEAAAGAGAAAAPTVSASEITSYERQRCISRELKALPWAAVGANVVVTRTIDEATLRRKRAGERRTKAIEAQKESAE